MKSAETNINIININIVESYVCYFKINNCLGSLVIRLI